MLVTYFYFRQNHPTESYIYKAKTATPAATTKLPKLAANEAAPPVEVGTGSWLVALALPALELEAPVEVAEDKVVLRE